MLSLRVPARSCGHVFCETCTKQFVATSGKCLNCDASCSPDKGIITIKQGGAWAGCGTRAQWLCAQHCDRRACRRVLLSGTGFAAHNDVEVKVYRPGMVF